MNADSQTMRRGSGIDEVNVPPHQFGKRGLRPAFGVLARQLLVGVAAVPEIG